MSDRGEYRAIRRVLLDGPDFQRLPERARALFLFLKVNFGPAGIDVWYPDELIARLTRQCGMPTSAVRDMLDLLEREGWIAREDNIVWIVGQLEHDPHIRSSDEKHRKGVMSHLGGLPKLDLVRRFVTANEEWFPDDELRGKGLGWVLDGSTEGAGRVSQGSSEDHRSTDNKPEDKPEDNNQPEGADAPDGSDADAKKKSLADAVKRVSTHYTTTHPRRKITPELKKLIARRLDRHTADELIEAIDGNATDPWHVEKSKHELSYVLRNSEHVEMFVEKHRAMAANASAPGSEHGADTSTRRADALYRLFVQHGFSQPLPIEQHDAKIDALAAEGALKQPERIKLELRAVAPWGWFRSVRPGFERQAIERIARDIATVPRTNGATNGAAATTPAGGA